MVRVTHSLETVLSGGVERRHLLLCSHEGPYEHQVLCSKAQGPIAGRLAELNIETVELGEPTVSGIPARVRHAHGVMKRWQPDIVHGAVIDGYITGTLAGRLLRTPVLIMEETSDPTNRGANGHRLAQLLARLSDHCIAVSAGVGRYLSQDLGVPTRKVSVINNGVEMPSVPTGDLLARVRSELSLPKDCPVIGSIGRMHDETHKRFGDLIYACARLSADPLPHLVLVGDGRERPGLERLARDLGIADRVHFVGFQAEPGHYYALMDIFALTSEREAFGLVNAEAMRCGLPVVATNVGGIPDVVTHNQTGILVPPRDIPAITNALQTLIDNPDLRHRMGAAGKQRADTHFSAERYVNDVHQLYQHLLANPRRGRRR